MFDIIDEKYFAVFFNFDTVKGELLTDQMRGQLTDLGYESHNAFTNLGTVGLITFVYFIRVAIWLMLTFYNRFASTNFGPNMLLKYKKQLFFNEILTIMLEGYLEYLIASRLSLDNDVDAYSGEVISDVLGYYGLAVCGIMPINFLCAVVQKQKDVKWYAYFDGV